MAPSARDQPVSFTRLPVLDDYANKHWNGLVRDFYAKRVECYVNQAALDVPAVPPTPGVCKMGALMAGTYLSNYPKSLGSGGIQPPAKWPYNASSLESAAAWCCKHGDCGGVTHQNGRQATIISALFLRLCGVIVALCFFFNSFIHSFILLLCRFEVRAGNFPIKGTADSYVNKNAGGLNTGNLTKCVTTAEMDFTQGTTEKYLELPTT